jgi:hypothetical protein
MHEVNGKLFLKILSLVSLTDKAQAINEPKDKLSFLRVAVELLTDGVEPSLTDSNQLLLFIRIILFHA